MESNQQNKTEYGLWIDFPFFFRTLKKWMVVLMTLAVTAACLGYIGGNLFIKDTYTASALLSIVPKNNVATNMTKKYIEAAVARNVDMWNSESMLKLIQDSDPARKFSGTLRADDISDTSLVNVTASADSAQDAYYLLSTAVRNFHQIEGDYDNKYVGVMLTGVSAESIYVSYTNPLIFAVAGFAFVILCGMFILFIWCCFTNVLHKDFQATDLLAVPLYESLAHVDIKNSNSKALLITQQNCDIDYIEGMDKLTSRVEQHMKAAGQKILLVTSIQENEGKSTVSTNLAMNLSRRGRKTLLIDMDFRKPALYKIFDRKKQDRGFSDTLSKGKKPLPEPVMLKEAYGLKVFFQYKSVREADRLLEQDEIKNALKQLSEKYDYIILDTPPLAPVRDSEVIAHMADCSLLIIRQDYNRATVANDVTDQLDELGATCMGAVLNNCHAYRRIGRKDYGYRYNYNYSEGSE